MLNALKKALRFWTFDHSKTSAETPLFSGYAYFSNHVPKFLSEKWMAHGGAILSGTTWDARARYFFAIDPSDPWVAKLLAKSVMVFHAGWIAHCVDEAFQVSIAEYLLDDRFVIEFPYKLTSNLALPIYVPLSESGGPTDTESGETGSMHVQAPDTPSTPTSMPRKRKRQQAYFDSPSGSLVFSGFDKDGLPRRPRKQRRLRFDSSFSPHGSRSAKETTQGVGFDWFQDHHDSARNDDKLSKEHGDDDVLHGRTATVWRPNTPDKSFANEMQPATQRFLSLQEHLSGSNQVSSPAISIDEKEKMTPVRTIDFTNVPPPTRRWRFPGADSTKSGNIGAILSVVKAHDHKEKTPKKISFANHARVCVYMVSPRRLDSKDDTNVSPSRQSLSERFEDGPMPDDRIRQSGEEAKGSDDSTVEATVHLPPRTDLPNISDDTLRLLDEDQSESGVLTLTMKEVQVMRRHLLDSAEKNGIDSGQLVTLFELGKSFRGLMFHHVW